MNRGKPLRRTAMKRGSKRINPMSDKRRAENDERRQVLYDKWGRYPACQLCPVLAAAGIRTGCDGNADDADEILRRSRGGSIVDLDNIRPVGRACHDWIGRNVERAKELGLTPSRYA